MEWEVRRLGRHLPQREGERIHLIHDSMNCDLTTPSALRYRFLSPQNTSNIIYDVYIQAVVSKPDATTLKAYTQYDKFLTILRF